MTSLQFRKTFKVDSRLEPFYTGGAVQLSPDGDTLACSCGDEVKLVSLKTGSVTKTLLGDSEPITALTFSTNGKTLFTSSRSLQSKRWDVEKGETTRVWKAHDAPIADMAVDRSGWLLATGSADRSARVWDSEKGHCTHSFRNHRGIVLRVVFHPDPQKLVLFTSSDEGEVKAWDLTTKSPLATLSGHASAVTGLAVSPCGRMLLSGGRDKVVSVWDLGSMKRAASVAVFEALEGLVLLGPAMQAHLPPLNPPKKGGVPVTYFVTAGESGLVKVWRSDTGKCVHQVGSGSGPKATEGQEAAELESGSSSAPAWSVDYLQALPSGRGVLVATADARLATLEPSPAVLEGGKQAGVGGKQGGGGAGHHRHHPLTLTRQLIGTNDEIIDVRFAGPEGELLAVVSNSEQVRVHSVSGLGCVGILAGHSDMVLSCDTAVATRGMKGANKPEVGSPSLRTLIATGSKDQTIRVWEMLPGNAVSSLVPVCLGYGKGHVGAVSAVALSRGRGPPAFMVSGGADKLLKVWDLASLPDEPQPDQVAVKLHTKAAVAAHDKDINAVAVAPNNQLLCTGAQDRVAKLWRLPELSLVATLRGHKRGVWSVDFSPTDQVVATGSGDRSVRLWSLSDGACLRTFEGHTASVLRVSFCNLGTQVASVGSDGLLKLWAVKTSECVNTFDEHLDKVWALGVSESQHQHEDEAGGGGRGSAVVVRLVTGGADGRVNLWQDITEEEAREREEAAQELELQCQALQTALQRGDYGAAVRGALKLKQPDRARTTFHQLHQKHGGSGSKLGEVLRSLEAESLARCLEYLREWNTNSRHCHVSAWVLRTMLKCFSPKEISAIPNSQDLLSGIQSYNLRHFSRIDRLVRSTFLLDFTLSSMTVLEDQPVSQDMDELITNTDSVPERIDVSLKEGKENQNEKKSKKQKDQDTATPKRKAKYIEATPKSKVKKSAKKSVMADE